MNSNNSFNNINSELKQRLDNLELLNITKGHVLETVQILEGTLKTKKIKKHDKQIIVTSGIIKIHSGNIEIGEGILTLSSNDYADGLKNVNTGTQILINMDSKLFVKSTTTCIGDELTVYGYVEIVSNNELEITSMDITGQQCCDTLYTMCGTTNVNLLNTTKNITVGGNLVMKSAVGQTQKFTMGDACLVIHVEATGTVDLMIDQYIKSLVIIIKNSKHEDDEGAKFINVFTSTNKELKETIQFGKTATFLQNFPGIFTKICET